MQTARSVPLPPGKKTAAVDPKTWADGGDTGSASRAIHDDRRRAARSRRRRGSQVLPSRSRSSGTEITATACDQ